MISAFIANAAPVIEAVERRRLINFVRHCRARCEACPLMRFHAHRGSISGRITFTLAHRYQCDVAVWCHVKAILAGFLHCEGEVRSIDLVDLRPIKLANSQVQRSLVQLDLNSTVADVGQRQAGFVIRANQTRPDA
jgi:hypothetical protein